MRVKPITYLAFINEFCPKIFFMLTEKFQNVPAYGFSARFQLSSHFKQFLLLLVLAVSVIKLTDQLMKTLHKVFSLGKLTKQAYYPCPQEEKFLALEK